MILLQQRTLQLQLYAYGGTIATLIRRVHQQRHGSSLLSPVVKQTAVVQTQKKCFLSGSVGSPTRRSFTPTVTTTTPTAKRQIRSLHGSQLRLSSSSSTTASEPSAPPPPPAPLTNIQDPNTQQPEDPQLAEFSLEFPPPQYELPILQPPSLPHTVLKVKNDTPPPTTTSPYGRFLGPRFHHVVQKLVSVPYQQNILWQSEGLFQLASQQAKNPYVRVHTQAQAQSLVACLASFFFTPLIF
jgi:hypothetical protein